MRVLLLGASGMVGQGVLRECLLAEDVSEVVAVGRSPLAVSHPKLTVLVRADLADPAAIASLPGHFDACFFCVGVTSFRMDEATYTRLTYDMTLAVATALSRRDPDMTFVYVSGAGADSTEHGKTMWARVRGRTENALARLPFRRVHAIRPGIIRPMHGVTSRTRAYRMLYPIFAPCCRYCAHGAPTSWRQPSRSDRPYSDWRATATARPSLRWQISKKSHSERAKPHHWALVGRTMSA